MRIILEQRTRGLGELGLLYGGIAAVGLAAVRFLPVKVLIPSCVFRGLLGIACPTCGGTRATIALARGDVLEAIALNPLLTVVILLMLLQGTLSAASYVLSTRCPIVRIDEGDGNWIRAIAVILFLANWVYLIFTL